MALDIKKIMNNSGSSPNCIKDAEIKLINYRIEQEELSSRIYRGMYVWLDMNGYRAAKLWKKYSDEEQSHADAFYGYLLDLNVMPDVPALPKVENNFASLMDVAQKSLQHEILVTNQIEALSNQAMKSGDTKTMAMAQKYLLEQIEELSKTQYWVDRLKLAGDDKSAILEIDEEMGEAA